MSVKSFIDTNIFVYTFDTSAVKKQVAARGIIERGLESKESVISWQVVQEFISVAGGKFKVPLCRKDLVEYLEHVLTPLCEVFPTISLYRNALQVKEQYQLPFYDALIVASANEAGCKELISEDFQSGQRIGGLTVVNPFR
jgi:predicted nucleic acid-binding protein